jgi:hypothetical protein
VALVIGNGAYRAGGMPPLPNPANDAADVAAALERIGFEVFKGTDLGRLEMEDLAVRFARAADRADMAVAFYAGHGLQVGGRNYLVPVDARVEDERDLRRLIAADDLVDDASTARKLAVVMLDACRDNPLSRGLGAGPDALVGRARAGAAEPGAGADADRLRHGRRGGGGGRRGPQQPVHDGPPQAPRRARARGAAAVRQGARLRGGRDRGRAAAEHLRRPRGRPDLPLPRAPEPQEQEPAMALEERRAVQRALAVLGHYRGPEDGALSFQLRAAIHALQISLGAPGTGYVTAEQLVELHRLARARRPPEKLPRLGLIQVLQESEAGDVEAQLHRGMLHDARYEAGALPKDAKEAARWYRRAAEAGNAPAALNLGRILAAGAEGVGRDPAEAARLLRLAAAAGDGSAQLELAELLHEGAGAERGDAEAVRLLRSAAAAPDGAEAIARLRVLGAWEVGEAAAPLTRR